MSSNKVNLVTYFGGKGQMLHWLIPLLPVGNYHFIDAMCGAANVALNVRYPLITVNDINEEMINLFRVLREDFDEFCRLVYFTPFSRKELINILEAEPTEDRIERARRYFARCQMGYGANGSQNNHKGMGFEYKPYPSAYYRVDGWNDKLEKLRDVVDRMRHFQIESVNVIDLIKKVDRKDTVIYLDPPYVLSTRKSKKRYIHECEDDFHTELLTAAKEAKHAFIAISGYENDLYNEILNGWHVTKSPENRTNTGKVPRVEVLWTNYDPNTVNGQIAMDI